MRKKWDFMNPVPYRNIGKQERKESDDGVKCVCVVGVSKSPYFLLIGMKKGGKGNKFIRRYRHIHWARSRWRKLVEPVEPGHAGQKQQSDGQLRHQPYPKEANECRHQQQ